MDLIPAGNAARTLLEGITSRRNGKMVAARRRLKQPRET
jgi:cellobiose-specific phosphotransferase system component IIA